MQSGAVSKGYKSPPGRTPKLSDREPSEYPEIICLWKKLDIPAFRCYFPSLTVEDLKNTRKSLFMGCLVLFLSFGLLYVPESKGGDKKEPVMIE